MVIQVTTRFSVGDEVSFLNGDHQCVTERVKSVNVFDYGDGSPRVSYSTENFINLYDKDLHASPAALSKWIFGSLETYEPNSDGQ